MDELKDFIKDFIIYTDGGCIGNRRDGGCIGGYGFAILDKIDPAMCLYKDGGSMNNVTNNIMELYAVIKGLQFLRKSIKDTKLFPIYDCTCVVRSDSKYIIDNYEEYIDTWKKNGWRKSNGTIILNKELWKEMDELTRGFKSFKFEWVKGHSGDLLNEYVDTLAKSYMKEHIKELNLTQ